MARHRVYSRFAKREGVTFFPRPGFKELQPANPVPYKCPGLSKKMKDPRMRTVVLALVKIAMHGLWPAFQKAKETMGREEAAAYVVRLFRRGCK